MSRSHTRFISLIHGTRRLNRITPNRQWMCNLRKHLLDNGVAEVSCFSWSGSVVRGLRSADAPAYADQLLDIHQAVRAGGGSLSIVAKSLGGWIAEQALASLSGQIEIDLFLRIGVPDFRTVVPLPNVSRIVNVTSRNDNLYRVGKWISPLFLPHGAEGPKINEIVLTDASHFSLTECVRLDGEGTTYDLYQQLLDATSEVTEVAERFGRLASRRSIQPEDR